MKGLRNKSAVKQGEKNDVAFPQITAITYIHF